MRSHEVGLDLRIFIIYCVCEQRRMCSLIYGLTWAITICKYDKCPLHMHQPICDFFFHHRNTAIGRFQYLGIDRITGGPQAISKWLLSCPLLGGCSYAYACVRFCSQLSHLISQPPQHTHTPAQCMTLHTVDRGANKEKCNRQCTCTKCRDVWS